MLYKDKITSEMYLSSVEKSYITLTVMNVRVVCDEARDVMYGRSDRLHAS